MNSVPLVAAALVLVLVSVDCSPLSQHFEAALNQSPADAKQPERLDVHTMMKRIRELVEADERRGVPLSTARAAGPQVQSAATKNMTSKARQFFDFSQPQQQMVPLFSMFGPMNQQRNVQLLPQLQDIGNLFSVLSEKTGPVVQGAQKQVAQVFPVLEQPGGLGGALLTALGSPPGSNSDGFLGIAGFLRKIYKSIELLRNELESIIFEEFGVARPTKTIDTSKESKGDEPANQHDDKQTTAAPPEANKSRSLTTISQQVSSSTETEITAEGSESDSISVEEPQEGKEPVAPASSECEKRLRAFLKDINALLGIIKNLIFNLDLRNILTPVAGANFALGTSQRV